MDNLAALDDINDLSHNFDELEDALDSLDEADFAQLTRSSSNVGGWGRKLKRVAKKAVHVVKKGYALYRKCTGNAVCNAAKNYAVKAAFSG